MTVMEIHWECQTIHLVLRQGQQGPALGRITLGPVSNATSGCDGLSR